MTRVWALHNKSRKVLGLLLSIFSIQLGVYAWLLTKGVGEYIQHLHISL